MQHRVFPFRFDMALIGRLPVRDHHSNPSAQMLFVKTERLSALACEIHIGVHLHGLSTSPYSLVDLAGPRSTGAREKTGLQPWMTEKVVLHRQDARPKIADAAAGASRFEEIVRSVLSWLASSDGGASRSEAWYPKRSGVLSWLLRRPSAWLRPPVQSRCHDHV